jgi:hypothetical protein
MHACVCVYMCVHACLRAREYVCVCYACGARDRRSVTGDWLSSRSSQVWPANSLSPETLCHYRLSSSQQTTGRVYLHGLFNNVLRYTFTWDKI